MQSYRLAFLSKWRQDIWPESENGAGALLADSNGSTLGLNGGGKMDIPACAGLAGLAEVYTAASIRDPKLGYSILKIAEMLESEHIRGLPPEIQRGSVLMALEAAGVQLEQVLQDTSQRQRALCAYEAAQQKRLEEFEAHKVQEIANVQAELERITAESQTRIKNTRDEISQEQERFRSWQARKAVEAQRLSDTIALCVAPGKVIHIQSGTPSHERAALADDQRRPPGPLSASPDLPTKVPGG